MYPASAFYEGVSPLGLARQLIFVVINLRDYMKIKERVLSRNDIDEMVEEKGVLLIPPFSAEQVKDKEETWLIHFDNKENGVVAYLGKDSVEYFFLLEGEPLFSSCNEIEFFDKIVRLGKMFNVNRDAYSYPY